MTSSHQLVTPEGAVLPFERAVVADRIVAFALDALMIALALTIVTLVVLLLPVALGAPLFLLAFFLLTQFYFTWFELRWQGQTPGKRWTDLRVIDRHGGRLTAAAIFARNFTRQGETFLPFLLLVAPSAASGHDPFWVTLLSWGWLLLMMLFPLWSAERLRIGDLIAGTIVVRAPRRVLLPDLATTAAPEGAGLVFTQAELDVYGIHELQVLEELLRSRRRADRAAALEAVAAKVARKIGRPGLGDRSPEQFLSAFYAAQRARLEQKLLFGERKERKSG